MDTANRVHQAEQMQSLFDRLSQALLLLPDEQKASALGDLRSLKAGVGRLLEGEAADQADCGEAQEQTRQVYEAGEAKYRELAESINDGFYELDQDWCFTYINQRAAHNVGFSPQSLIGKNIWEVFPRILGTDHERYYRQVMETRQPANFELSGVLTHKKYDIRVYPSNVGITTFWIDISDRVQAQEAQRKSEEKFEKVFRSSPIALAISTIEDGRFVEVNDQYGEIYQYSREEIIGHTSIELGIITPEDRKEIIRKFKEGRGFRNVELKGHAKTGEVRYLLFSTEPIEIDGKGFMLSVVIDMTDRKRTEEVLRERIVQTEIQRRLLDYREQERQMIARDLHDGPIQDLTSMLFNIQFAKEAITDLAIKVELDRIALGMKSTVQNLRSMINEMRPPSLVRFGLAKAIQVYLDEFKEKHPGILVELDLMDDQDILSGQARLSLFRILQEALVNLVKHSEAARVAIALEHNDHQSILEIRDNGKGFALSSSIMEYSQNGHYGLIGMQERAEAVGGKLEIHSSPEEGTIIRVIVPRESQLAG